MLDRIKGSLLLIMEKIIEHQADHPSVWCFYFCKQAAPSADRKGVYRLIAVLKHGASPERTEHLISWLKEQNLGVHVSHGETHTVLGLIGNTSAVDMEMIQSLDIVETVTRVSDPFKAVNRKFHPDDTVIQVGGTAIGGGNFALIAGPCSVENEAQITFVANRVKQAGANFLRGGAFKPRTSPYDFQGLGAEGNCRVLLKG